MHDSLVVIDDKDDRTVGSSGFSRHSVGRASSHVGTSRSRNAAASHRMIVERVLTIAGQRGKHRGTFQQNQRQPIEIAYEPRPGSEPFVDEPRNKHRFPQCVPAPNDDR
jgi:hypothetical protein